MAKPTRQAVINAIEGSAGIVSNVARKLGVAWHTAKRYIESWEATREAFEAERERVTDLAESRLIDEINGGEQWAVKFWLTTKGRTRGFISRQEIAAELDGEINVNIVRH